MPASSRTGGWFPLIFGLTLLLLATTLMASFIATGWWTWAVGLVYIAYDSRLLIRTTWAAWRAVQEAEAERTVRAEWQAGSGIPVPETVPTPSVAVLIAARNERMVLSATLAAVLGQGMPSPTDGQPALRVVLIDDGSDDGTADWLLAEWGVPLADQSAGLRISVRDPRLQVLRTPGGSKARALNAALALVDADVVVTLDADTVLDPGALGALAAAFRDPAIDVAGGVLVPTCGGAAPDPLARTMAWYQRCEYQRSYLWRLVWSRAGSLVLVSGAFAAFRRHRLQAVGGFDPLSRVEDYEVLYRLHRAAADGGRILGTVMVPEARAVTDAPDRLAQFLRQRRRWFAGFIATLVRHRDLVGDRRLGALGRRHLPLKTVDTLLPVYALAALAVLVVWLATGHSLHPVVIAALVAKFAIDLTCHGLCVGLYHRWLGQPMPPGERRRGLLATLTEPFGFQLVRQLGAVLGWWLVLRGRIDWAPQRLRRIP